MEGPFEARIIEVRREIEDGEEVVTTVYEQPPQLSFEETLAVLRALAEANHQAVTPAADLSLQPSEQLAAGPAQICVDSETGEKIPVVTGNDGTGFYEINPSGGFSCII